MDAINVLNQRIWELEGVNDSLLTSIKSIEKKLRQKGNQTLLNDEELDILNVCTVTLKAYQPST